MKRVFLAPVLGVLLLVGLASPALAGVTVYEDGDRKLEVGGRIQIQYLQTDPDGGPSRDDLFFRRLRPYLQGSLDERWLAKIQFDFGKSLDGDEVALKDAYLQYKHDRYKVTLGNAKHAFSREFLASSTKQQLVERSFAGDHNYGSPDRVLGAKIDGHNKSKKFTYVAGVGIGSHDPSAIHLDFDSPANDRADWNEGAVVSGRIDFHPLGYMKFDQADFRTTDWKFTVGAGFFNWNNDGDNNTYTDDMGGSLDPSRADLDQADGLELSGGVRGRGVSADVEYQVISAESVVADFTGGIYANGEADLDKLAVEAGYMVSEKLEVVAGWDSFDADTYADAHTRTSVGLNYYVKKHDLKFQATYQMVESQLGVVGNDTNLLFVQAQIVF
jgi:hypothetical protein